VHESPERSAPTPPLAWDDVGYFLAVARQGSLSAAARLLGVEHATVARRVGALEARIALRLFDRLPRAWVLTREGQALLAPAERLEQEALAFARAALAGNAKLGPVRVSAPPLLASHFLVPRLAARAAQWAGIELELVGEVRNADLHRREADVALRLMRPEAPGLAGRRLGHLAFRLYGTADWAGRAPADWRFIGYGDSLRESPQQRVLERLAAGRPFLLRSNDLAALYQACRSGLGLAMLPRFLAGADPVLHELASEATPVRREIWCVLHPDVRRSPRVRLIADAIAELLREAAQELDG